MTAVAEQTGVVAGALHQPTCGAAAVAPGRCASAAFARFAELGFPTTHNEEWRFTNVAPIARSTFRAGNRSGLRDGSRERQEARARRGARQYLARHAAIDGNAFVALNTAFLDRRHSPSGAAQRGDRAAHRNHLRRRRTAASAHPRVLILVGANAQCTIVETYKGAGTLLHQRRHRNRGRRRRRGGSLQGPAGNRPGLPRRHPAGHAGTQRRTSRRTPFRWAARWCATTPTRSSPKAPTPR